MALIRKKIDSNLPGDLVKISEDEALNYQSQLIANWQPQSDIWPFRYSLSFLAGMGALSGIYINRHYRAKLHLRDMARISTYIPIVALPGIITALFHNQFVQFDVMIRKTACPVCVQMRAAALQVGIGVLYPMILAPLATFTFASRLHTYNIPYLSSADGRRQALQLWRKITYPIATPLLIIVGLQAIAATFITAAEQRCVEKIHLKLKELEEKYEMEHSS